MDKKKGNDDTDRLTPDMEPEDVPPDSSPGAESTPSTSDNLPNSPRHHTIPASPPKFVSFDQLMSAAKGLSNMALAHEIAVNKDFKLEKMQSPEQSIHKQVTEIVHQAFWDSLHAKFAETPPDYSGLLVLLAEIKQILLELLLPQHQRLKAHITEVLDMDLIAQKVANEVPDVQYYADFVITIMARLCAPARDDDVAQLRHTSDIIPLFKQIFSVLDLMRMDMANFTLQQVRPYIQQQSVDFERQKFQDFLKIQEDLGVDGLEFTKVWLRRNYLKLTSLVNASSLGEAAGKPTSSATSATPTTSATSATPSTSAASATPITPAAILNAAYLETLDWEYDLQVDVYPETLLIDRDRFFKLRDQSRHLCLVATLLLVTYNVVGESISGISGLKNQLKSDMTLLLQDVNECDLAPKLSGIADHVIKTVNAVLVKHSYAVLSEVKVTSIKQQFTSAYKPDNPVHRIIRSRVFEFIRDLLSHGCKPPARIPSGLSAMEEELAALCGQFLRLVSHNRSVFGFYYGDIIDNLLQTT